jgi:hypothetical protein
MPHIVGSVVYAYYLSVACYSRASAQGSPTPCTSPSTKLPTGPNTWGEFGSTAKCDGDAGGQIIYSSSALSHLSAKDHAKGLHGLLMGEHLLETDGQAAQPLYQTLIRGPEPRLAIFLLLRTEGA